MKKLQTVCFLLAVALSVSSCKKDTAGSGGGPNEVLPTSGFLCTKTNYKAAGGYDTVVYYSSTLARNVSGYLKGAGKDADEVTMITNGDNTVSIKLKIPLRSGGRDYYYFVAQFNSNPPSSTFPSHEYLFNYAEANSSESSLVLKRSAADKLKFTLESKAHPGQFLGTGRGKSSTDKNDDNLVFSSVQQEFFFKVD